MIPKKTSTGKSIIGSIIFAIIIVYCIGKFFGSNNTKESSANPDSSSTSTTLAEKNSVPQLSSGWHFYEDEDKMTSKKSYFAQVDASDLLQFNSPYDGGSVASLIIRNRRNKNNVIIQVSKGQFLTRSYEGTDYYVRFDSKPATLYSFSGPTDGSSNVAFISSAENFISKLKKAKKLIIEMEFYEEGKRQIEFNVDGFKWHH